MHRIRADKLVPVTIATSQLRRIAVRSAGVQHDLVVPQGDALAHALAAAGVRLGPTQRVLDPSGSAVDVSTPAAQLREGWVYSVAGPPAARRRGAHPGSPQVTAQVSPLAWSLVTLGGAAALLAMFDPHGPLRWVAVSTLAVAAMLVSLVWGARTDERTSVTGMAVPLALAGAAGSLAVPGVLTASAPGRIALACVAIAVGGALLAVVARAPHIRAAAGPVVVIMGVIAALALVSPQLRWDAAQLAIVVGAFGVVGVRAAPSLMVSVDEGYHIDYGRFMVLRWTVRGRVPEFRPFVEISEVRRYVANAEARLEATVLLCSTLAAVGTVALALPLTADDLVARIAAGVAAVCMPLGLLLTSRRTAAKALKMPPRAAVAAGLLGFTLLLALRTDSLTLLIGGGCLLAAGIIAATLVLPLARGHRSLGWSRTGDIVDSIAVAFALPAALLAAGTLVLLRGVLVG